MKQIGERDVVINEAMKFDKKSIQMSAAIGIANIVILLFVAFLAHVIPMHALALGF